MFSKLYMKDVVAFSDFMWSSHGRVNVVAGENDTGKSHLLKMLYVVAKSVEEFTKKGEPNGRTWSRVISDKLRWTFQPASGLGALIRKGAGSAKVAATLGGQEISFTLEAGSGGGSRIKSTLGSQRSRSSAQPATKNKVTESTREGILQEGINSLFIPPKEILTTFSAIAATREALEIYGFDDTYYDLIKLLRIPPTQGAIDEDLASVLGTLGALFRGEIIKSTSSDDFTFERGKTSYGMPQTADGIKKIGILATLIKNRSLHRKSILFLDEPETNLHPRAITLFTRMLFQIGQTGAQVYVATHSYFVIKQLQILAKQHGQRVPFCSLRRRGDEIDVQISDLAEGMPENPIVDESIRLYQEEIEVDLARQR